MGYLSFYSPQMRHFQENSVATMLSVQGMWYEVSMCALTSSLTPLVQYLFKFFI